MSVSVVHSTMKTKTILSIPHRYNIIEGIVHKAMESLRGQTSSKRLTTAESCLHLEAGGTKGQGGLNRGWSDLEEPGTMMDQSNRANAAASARNITQGNSVQVQKYPGF